MYSHPRGGALIQWWRYLIMNLVGKTAVITGASGGIGQALAWELARVGIKRLLLLGRNRPKLAELAGQIQGEGVEVVTLAVDLTQPGRY